MPPKKVAQAKLDVLALEKLLVIANVELAKRAAELVIANVELAFQTDEKAKRAAELVIANVAFLKLDQTTLEKIEERLSLAVSTHGIGIWDWNLQTMEMVWDESMFELYHMKHEDFTHAVDAWEKSLHPDDRQRAEREIEEAINNEKPFDSQFRIVRPNGDIRHIKATAKVFRDLHGAPLRMLGANMDVTERTLIDMIKSELVATVAHELRTPLTVINGYTELLQMGVVDTETQQEMLGSIHRQSQAMIHLLNDILDVAKIEAEAAGLYQMELQQIGPRLQTLAETFITPDNHNKITLEMSLNLPEVKVDVAKIEQAVKNCLSNAYKFSPERGEVTMRVTEVTHDKQRKMLIAIEDQGIGMTPEQLERVFEKFYRADPSGAIPGTGLGMAIIKNIIEQHGGAIMIDSEYGKGTKVMLYLPVA
jgi:PAS domain S-box-containing protein